MRIRFYKTSARLDEQRHSIRRVFDLLQAGAMKDSLHYQPERRYLPARASTGERRKYFYSRCVIRAT